MADLLELRDLSRSFGGIKALEGVDLDIQSGGITAIIGPNGAGKTTLFNLIAGALRPSSGTVTFEDVDITRYNPARRCHLGIARTFQVPQPFSTMTLRENVEVGVRFGSRRSGGSMTESELQEKAGSILENIGVASELVDSLPARLSAGGMKQLELARALGTGPKVLLADEVCGGLSAQELPGMEAALSRIAESGITVVMIEHVISVVIAIAKRIVVLDRGAIIADGTPDEIVNSEAVRVAYLGETYVA